jgi:hypothetical protein
MNNRRLVGERLSRVRQRPPVRHLSSEFDLHPNLLMPAGCQFIFNKQPESWINGLRACSTRSPRAWSAFWCLFRLGMVREQCHRSIFRPREPSLTRDEIDSFKYVTLFEGTLFAVSRPDC